MNPVISYKHGGYDSLNRAITNIYATLSDGNPYHVATIIKPGAGISTSWQENELDAVNRKCKEIYPEGFSLPYCVDQHGYVYPLA